VPNQHRTKVHPKSTPGIFIGYSTESKGYRFYDPENNKLVESRDAIFLDHQTPRRTKRARVELLATPDEPHFDTSRINSLDEENITPEGNTNQTPNASRLRRSGRNTQAPSYLDEYYVFWGEVHSKISDLEEDPKTYKEAISCPHSKLWVEAMREELNSMRKNKVWELVSLPNNRKPVG